MKSLPLTLSGEPEIFELAVWAAGEFATHTSFVVAGLSPIQHHLVARPIIEGDTIKLRLHSDPVPAGAYRLIALVGFHGAVEVPAETIVSSHVIMTSVADPTLHLGYAAMVHPSENPGLPPTHLSPLITGFKTSDVGPGAMTLEVSYFFNNVHVDPKHPPMLVGVRLISM